jgi:hypothetical protein
MDRVANANLAAEVFMDFSFGIGGLQIHRHGVATSTNVEIDSGEDYTVEEL